jgi:hypothetical protein
MIVALFGFRGEPQVNRRDWSNEMGDFHAEGDCVPRSRGGLAKASFEDDRCSREGGGREDGFRLGVAGQNARKAASRGQYPAGLLMRESSLELVDVVARSAALGPGVIGMCS